MKVGENLLRFSLGTLQTTKAQNILEKLTLDTNSYDSSPSLQVLTSCN